MTIDAYVHWVFAGMLTVMGVGMSVLVVLLIFLFIKMLRED